jgi:hypothetical protein
MWRLSIVVVGAVPVLLPLPAARAAAAAAAGLVEENTALLLAVAAPPPPCPVAPPSGFVPAPQQGWWVDSSCQNMSCAKPDISHRHGISIECCAEYCAADPDCQGFEIFQPCGISDCYAYHHIDNSTFTPHTGAHSFSWSGTRRPAVRNVSARCVPTAKLCGHPVVLDEQQKILPWSAGNVSAGGAAGAYEHSARLAWSWFDHMPTQDGYPLFFFYGSFTPSSGQGRTWPSTPASMAQYTASAATRWFAFTGDSDPVWKLAVPLSKYILANGTTPADFLWGSMPYASAKGGAETFGGVNHGKCIEMPDGTWRGCSGDGVGHIEPDKAADAAFGFNILANVTGDASLRHAAVAVADTLAVLVRPAPLSNGTNAPWPFRVDAKSGVVVEQYTSNVYSHLRLLDQLIGCSLVDMKHALKLANGSTLPREAAYRRAHAIALEWMIKWPQQTGAWTACCEDVGVDVSLTNFNSIQPMWALFYYVEHRIDGWQEMAEELLQFVVSSSIYFCPQLEPPQPQPRDVSR